MLPVLPLIVVGMAAAAAGWVGAGVWKRLSGRPGDEDGAVSDDATGPRPVVDPAPPRAARSLAWCPACSTWFVAGETHGCEGPDCPRAASGVGQQG